MKISETQVRDSIRRWYGSRWFAPNKLKRAALTDTVKGLYIPYWTFDAQVHADWTAESGYHYYETETYTDANGKTQTRQVQKIRWVPSSGSLDHFFDDELVPASRGVQPEMLRKIEPFPTKNELVPYNAGFLSGWVVERYQIDLVAAAKDARDGNGCRNGTALRRRSAGRHVSEPAGGRGLFRPDVQAHPRAASGCSPTTTARRISRSSSTVTPAPSPGNIRRAG